MSTLILDRSNLTVRDVGTALALYQNAERRGTVPIKLLERVVIQGSSMEISTGAILKLAEQGVAVVFLSPRQSRRVGVLLGPAHNDASVRLAQLTWVQDETLRCAWSREIVMGKVGRQRNVIARLRERRSDCRKPLTDALRTLDSVCSSIARYEPGIEELRGFEGGAASAYFRGFSRAFAPSLEFTGRNRRPPRDPVNACLSLSYTLLHFDAVRAAHTAGLDPLLGFYHRPAHGRESLACDLIELLRPIADEWVWRLFLERTLRPEHFHKDKGACLLSKAGRSHFYAAWEPFAKLPRRYLRRQCAKLANSLRGEGEAQLQGWADELDGEIE